jgi:hypothetical protein
VGWLAALALAHREGRADDATALAAAHARLRTMAQDTYAGREVQVALDLSTLHLEGAALGGAHLETLYFCQLVEDACH